MITGCGSLFQNHFYQVRKMKINDEVCTIKGIGRKTAGHLNRIGIITVGDFLRHFPRDYISYGEPLPVTDISKDNCGPAAYQVRVTERPRPVSRSRNAVSVMRMNQANAIWYHSPYITNRLIPGREYILYGNMVTKGTRRSLEHPEIFLPEEYAKISTGLQPVYPLTEGLSQNFFRKTMRTILDQLELSDDILPVDLRKRQNLAEFNFAIRQIHFPDHRENLRSARNRLVFEEFFLFALLMKRLKKEHSTLPNSFPVKDLSAVDRFIQSLPFKLTGAQYRVWEEIAADLSGPDTMNRLIQGDVGSGKTAVAALAMLAMAKSGRQAALMAPTEVLAVQHYEKLSRLFEEQGLHTVLLTGSLTAAQKRKIYTQMQNQEADIIIGTQALFQEKAVYARLGLIVTDEQHRFGVVQRQRLADKSGEEAPHVLVMSATPIPRTLAIVLYSDLDISVLDEKPQNRLDIKTAVVGTSYRPNAYRFMLNQIEMGHQIYIICPMVEQSEQVDAENVLDYTERIKQIMPDSVRIGYVHGKMKPDEKNKVMQQFAEHQSDILVSTTVIEVGVDVPNATTILIENAERFGLAQLHQLRGRVGRGDSQSYCIFMYGQDTPQIRERLEILQKSRDGFEIAAQDLRLRGPGDFFGSMQSGALQFAIGDVFDDSAILLKAGEEADRILTCDPDLNLPYHQLLHIYIDKRLDPQEKQIVL